jgi:hypothetical protein
LGQKARRSAAVLLRSVDQEGMTEVDRPRFARRQSHLPLRADISQLQAGHSRFPDRGQKACHVKMRADADALRRIVFADVREQKQHEERAAARGDVDAPSRVIAPLGIAGLAGEADIDMPSEVAWVDRRGEAGDKLADVRARLPSPAPDQPVERDVQDGGIGGGPKGKRLRAVSVIHRPNTHDWMSPGARIIRIAACGPP